jgi:XTP/dITP diphosphohydrolase
MSTADRLPDIETAAFRVDGATTDLNSLKAIAALIALVDRLRDPVFGCPWDLEQTHSSLIPYVLEEAHEVADAIRHGDDQDLEEELGDLLLQVVLHARIAQEEGRFDLAGVAGRIAAKLVRRHPHVFAPDQRPGARPDAAAGEKPNRGLGGDSEAVRRSWEAIKAEETAAEAGPGAKSVGQVATPRASSPLSDRLRPKVRTLPALAGAMAISRKAAAAGFEWEDMDGVWEKVQEELNELREAVAVAMAGGDVLHAQEELGDVLFTLVNVARWCGINPEEGLAGTNRRFLDRFSRVEAAFDGNLSGRSIKELEELWQAAKAELRAEQDDLASP